MVKSVLEIIVDREDHDLYREFSKDYLYVKKTKDSHGGTIREIVQASSVLGECYQSLNDKVAALNFVKETLQRESVKQYDPNLEGREYAQQLGPLFTTLDLLSRFIHPDVFERYRVDVKDTLSTMATSGTYQELDPIGLTNPFADIDYLVRVPKGNSTQAIILRTLADYSNPEEVDKEFFISQISTEDMGVTRAAVYGLAKAYTNNRVDFIKDIFYTIKDIADDRMYSAIQAEFSDFSQAVELEARRQAYESSNQETLR